MCPSYLQMQMKTGFALISFLKCRYHASAQRLRMTPKPAMLHHFSLYFTLISIPYRTQVRTTFTICSLRMFRLASPPCTEGSGFLCPCPSPLPKAGLTLWGQGRPVLINSRHNKAALSISVPACQKRFYTMTENSLAKLTSKPQPQVLKKRKKKKLKWYKLLHLIPLGEVGNDFVIKDLLWGSGELVQFQALKQAPRSPWESLLHSPARMDTGRVICKCSQSSDDVVPTAK